MDHYMIDMINMQTKLCISVSVSHTSCKLIITKSGHHPHKNLFFLNSSSISTFLTISNCCILAKFGNMIVDNSRYTLSRPHIRQTMIEIIRALKCVTVLLLINRNIVTSNIFIYRAQHVILQHGPEEIIIYAIYRNTHVHIDC